MKILSPSLVFVGSQAAVGAGNYLFQVAAAKVLPLPIFGAWSVWFAQFAISLLVAAWVQSLATLDGRHQPLFGSWLRPARFLALICGLILLIVAGRFFDQPFLYSVSGWGWAILQAIFYGRALARGQLYLISFAMLVAVCLRVLVPVALYATGSDPTAAFYGGVLFTPAVTVFICGFGLFAKSAAPANTSDHSLSTRPSWRLIGTSLILAAIISWAPQFDILVAGQVLGPESMGYFGRVALVYKAFFFLILIFAQLLLSKQVQGNAQDLPLKYLLAVPGICLALATVLYFTFPAEWAPSHWAALGVMHIGTLTFLFLVSQTEISRQGWKFSALILASWFAEFLLAAVLKLPLETYYALVLAGDSLLIVWYSLRAKLKLAAP